VSAAQQRPTLYSPSYHFTDVGFLKVLPHPPYSPDFAFSNFHLFWPLKDALRGHHFTKDEEVKEVVHEWLAQQPKDLVCQGIYALVEHWRRCVEHGGDYTED
jgi:hypothetical protein